MMMYEFFVMDLCFEVGRWGGVKKCGGNVGSDERGESGGCGRWVVGSEW